jgi:hypothetical protein
MTICTELLSAASNLSAKKEIPIYLKTQTLIHHNHVQGKYPRKHRLGYAANLTPKPGERAV